MPIECVPHTRGDKPGAQQPVEQVSDLAVVDVEVYVGAGYCAIIPSRS
jgi:hypothetical protein